MKRFFIKLIIGLSLFSSIDTLAMEKSSSLDMLESASATAEADALTTSENVKNEADSKGLPEAQEARVFNIHEGSDLMEVAGNAQAPDAEREINSVELAD